MKQKIEVFSAGCKTCTDTVEAVRKLAGSEHEVVVRDMHQQEIASRAAQHGVRLVRHSPLQSGRLLPAERAAFDRLK